MAFDSLFDDITFLCKGGYGAVFTGKHKVTSITTAIKVCCFDDEKKAIAHREVGNLILLSKDHHENIIRYETCWAQAIELLANDHVKNILSAFRPTASANNIICIAMEYCDGSLREYLANVKGDFLSSMDLLNLKPNGYINGKPDSRDSSVFYPKRYVPDLLSIILQICSGIRFLHSLNMAHRDLKPGNVLFVTQSGRKTFKIADFGLAKINQISTTSNECGTLVYSSPEMLTCRPVGLSTDIYSLGVILLEMLRPIDGETTLKMALELMKKKKSLPVEFCREYPVLAPFILRMLSVDKKMRPDIGEVANLITGVSTDLVRVKPDVKRRKDCLLL